MLPINTVDALRDVVILSRQEGRISWAWLSKIKRLAKHFGITPDDMLDVVEVNWNLVQCEEWLTKNKPKKVRTNEVL